MTVDHWCTILGTMDNETDTEVVEGDPRNVVELGHSIMQAIWDNAYGDDGMPLPGDHDVAIGLTGAQWQLAATALAHWADVADDMEPGVDEDGSAERQVLGLIASRLTEGDAAR
jgi:hypothetical protein